MALRLTTTINQGVNHKEIENELGLRVRKDKDG